MTIKNLKLKKQKAQGKKGNMTTILFDGEVDINHDRFSMQITRY